MQQSIQLNILPFKPKESELTFQFVTQKPNHETFSPIHKDDLTGQLEGVIDESQLEHGDWLYTDFSDNLENAYRLTVNLLDCPFFALHYYRHILREYFRKHASLMHCNFTKDIVVWYEAKEQTSTKFTLYYQFTLKLQHARISDSAEMVVSYDGTTKVLKQSIAQIPNFDTTLYNWIAYKNRLYRYNYMPAEIKNETDKAFPVLTNTLKPHFAISFDSPDFTNRYPKYKQIIEGFVKKYLNNATLQEQLGFSPELYTADQEGEVGSISSESFDLEYGKDPQGNRYTGRDPHKDFKKYKAYNPAPPPNNVKFFFIYQTDQKTTAVKALYTFLKEGYKHERWPFPSMENYISQPLILDTSANIEFDNINTAFETIKNAVKTMKRQPDTKYMALFVNPVSKSEKDQTKINLYYKIKEVLLYEGILSQVIKSEHLFKYGKSNDFFNTFLPHIEVAILAKLGGIPWRLKRPSTNELIVGVGAFYSITRKTRFVGSAFCFNNEGIFKGFDCFRSQDALTLAGSIREAVAKFIAVNYQASRLVIHFYKDISKKELEPIMKTLHTLGLNIPVVIVTVNKTESKSVIGFDSLSKELMPQSGTYIKIGSNEYLLFNNTRYDETSKPAQKEYHFPLKLNLSCSIPDYFSDPNVANQLIDQVFQFSRMYWKSTNQQSVPVTIKYPEMVAQIYPHFSYDKLADFGKENLWFL